MSINLSGASGSVVLRASGGGGGVGPTGPTGPAGSSFIPTRHAVDANHLYVWHCGAGSTDGTNIIADKGGVNMTTSTSDTQLSSDVSMFKNTPSLITSKTTTGVSNFQTGNSLSIAGNASTSIEFIFQVSSWEHSSIPNWTFGFNLIGSTDQMSLRYTENNTSDGIVFGFTRQYNGSWGAAPIVKLNYGGSFDQVSVNHPHHAMMVWDVSSSSIKCYFDGRLVGTSAGNGSRSNPFTSAQANLIPFGGSVAEIRVSNIARDHSYAMEAFRKMRNL